MPKYIFTVLWHGNSLLPFQEVFKEALTHLLGHTLGASLSRLFKLQSLGNENNSFIQVSNLYEEKAGSTTIILVNEDEVVIMMCTMNPTLPDWPGV